MIQESGENSGKELQKILSFQESLSACVFEERGK
jgi:hypothetical protein